MIVPLGSGRRVRPDHTYAPEAGCTTCAPRPQRSARSSASGRRATAASAPMSTVVPPTEPEASLPPTRSDDSKTVTRRPARPSRSAAASPEMPAPTTATCAPGAGRGRVELTWPMLPDLPQMITIGCQDCVNGTQRVRTDVPAPVGDRHDPLGEGTQPMRRNRVTLAALLVGALVATAACSGGRSGDSSAGGTEGESAVAAGSATAS